MQALEREIIHPNWITILLIIAFALVATLSAIDSIKFRKTVFALFDRVFVEEEVEEKTSFLSLFNLTTFLFSLLIIALAVFKIIKSIAAESSSGFNFGLIFLGVLSYFILKRFVEFLFKVLFQFDESISFFQQFKNLSLYTVSFGLFIILTLNTFLSTSKYFLLYSVIFLFLIRFITLVVYNKNLILSKLFYFILYLCALELAPLIIIFKLTL